MKDTYGNAEKMASKGGKMVVYESQVLRLPSTYVFIPIRHIFVAFLSMSELLNLNLFSQGKEESV